MTATATRCPKCRGRIDEEWEREHVERFDCCAECRSEARPRCRECHGTYLMSDDRIICGLCDGAYENAKLGRY